MTVGIKESLDCKFWSTSVTRFNAAKRIESWTKCIRWSLLFSSIYLTILSILIYSGKIKPECLDASQFATIFLSLVILCLSLAVNLSELERKSVLYYESGRKISRLLDDMKFHSDVESLEKYSIAYAEILDGYDNHRRLDYYQFICQNNSRLDDKRKKNMFCFLALYCWVLALRYLPQLAFYIVTAVIPFAMVMRVTNF